MAVNVKITVFWNLSTKLQGITSHQNINPKKELWLNSILSCIITLQLSAYHFNINELSQPTSQ